MTHEQAADVFREFMAIVDKAPNTFIHELYRDIYEAAAVAIPLLEAATIPPEIEPEYVEHLNRIKG